jgi:DNA-binding NarL/FixJ family response regulator
MKRKIRILIVDDHAMIRFALSQAIKRHDDLVVVAETDNGDDALKLYRKHKPDVVTMDFKLPGMNGIECTELLLEEFHDSKVLLLSIYKGKEDVWHASQAGAMGYVAKSAEIDEVIHAIRCVAGGASYFSAGLREKLAGHQSTNTLTARELEVLRFIVAGRSNKEIQHELKVTLSTVKRHIENAFTKLGVTDRVQAITTALQSGIVHLDE